jgi:hypothetical protein
MPTFATYHLPGACRLYVQGELYKEAAHTRNCNLQIRKIIKLDGAWLMTKNILVNAVLWNRNRNRNFLPCGTGTETCQKVGIGTETVINYGSGTVRKWYHKSSHKHTV